MGGRAMPVVVKIPTPLRRFAGGQRAVTVEAPTVRAALDALVGAFPDMSAGLHRPDGSLRSDARLFVGAEDIRGLDGLDTLVRDGDVIAIIPPVAGA